MGMCIDEDNGGVKNRCWIFLIMLTSVLACTAMGFVIGLGITNSANNAAVDMTTDAAIAEYSTHITGFTAGIGSGLGLVSAGVSLALASFFPEGVKKPFVIMESVFAIVLAVWLLVSGILVFHLDTALGSPAWFQYTKTVFYTLSGISAFIGVHFLILGIDKSWVPCYLSMKGCCNSMNTEELSDTNVEPSNDPTLSRSRPLADGDEKTSHDSISIPKNSTLVISSHKREDGRPPARQVSRSARTPKQASAKIPADVRPHQHFKKVKSTEELRKKANNRLDLLPKQHGNARFKWTKAERFFNDWLVFQIGGEDLNKTKGLYPWSEETDDCVVSQRKRLLSRNTTIRLSKAENRF